MAFAIGQTLSWKECLVVITVDQDCDEVAASPTLSLPGKTAGTTHGETGWHVSAPPSHLPVTAAFSRCSELGVGTCQ